METIQFTELQNADVQNNRFRPRERDGTLPLLALAERVLGAHASNLDKYLYLNRVLGRLGRDPVQRAHLRIDVYEALFGPLEQGRPV